MGVPRTSLLKLKKVDLIKIKNNPLRIKLFTYT